MNKEDTEDCKTLYIACDKVELTENGYNVYITLPGSAIKEVNRITINGFTFINENALGRNGYVKDLGQYSICIDRETEKRHKL